MTTRFDRAFTEGDDGVLRAEDGSVVERIATGEDSVLGPLPLLAQR